MTEEKQTSVLLLEDDVLIALDLQHILENAGYRVIGPAFSTATALALIENETPALALLDANLGRTNSFELADILVARNAKVIFVTGHSRGWISEAHRHRRIIEKPFLPSDVLAAVENELNSLKCGDALNPACAA